MPYEESLPPLPISDILLSVLWKNKERDIDPGQSGTFPSIILRFIGCQSIGELVRRYRYIAKHILDMLT